MRNAAIVLIGMDSSVSANFFGGKCLFLLSPLILKMVGRMPEQSLFADHIFDMERILDKGGDLTFFCHIRLCSTAYVAIVFIFGMETVSGG